MPKPSPGSPVYCSGPMFSIADLWEQEQIAATLEHAQYTTYLPQRDGIEVARVMAMVSNGPMQDTGISEEIGELVRKAVFALDMFQLLERCQSLVFNMDGRVPDEGAVVETAASFVAGKPIVIFKTTPLTLIAGEDNPMVQGLSTTWAYAAKLTELAPALSAAVEASANAGTYTYHPPRHVSSVITLGHAVWDFLQAMRWVSGTEEELLALVEKLAGEFKGSSLFRSAFGG